ncbi:MAG: sulfite exporter TauE/SafE family protein [Jatrophihabitans sp.]|uniref:sulfite exporter TauE/SafE family protein n=1 Tax=Jatrophihabitans sp. TaxID=1932789 RepID=UPI003F80EACA
MHGALDELFLAGAGAVAGVIGTAGGITSLVAYPALLAVGIPPLVANVTNSVALLGSGASSTLQAGPDVVGHARTLRTWLPLAVTCSLAGAVLLVATPGAVFDGIVPFLVATGSLLLLAQPAIGRRLAQGTWRVPRSAVVTAGALVALYNGYFGAGSGILFVALLLLTTEPVLHRANSLKNAILFGADLLPAVVFALNGRVVWSAAAALGAGAVLGGLVGPSIARRVPAHVLRVVIGLGGLGLAAWLLLDAIG